MEQIKPMSQTLKFMFGSVILGISAIIMIFLSQLTDPFQARWLQNIMYIFFIFANIFTILAISSYYNEIRGK